MTITGAYPKRIFLGVTLLRPVPIEQRLMPAATLMTHRNGRLARGVEVTVGQRPETAKDVMLVTIEDETGNVKVIIWPSLQVKFRQEALGASLLAVYGTWQCGGRGPPHGRATACRLIAPAR